MTDPFSLSLGVVTVIGSAGTAIGKCYAYGCAVRSALDEAKALNKGLQDLSNVLGNLQEVAEALETSSQRLQFISLVSGCQAMLDEVNSQLDINAPVDSLRRSQRSWRRLTWPLRKSETLSLVNAVERQKSSLSLALGGLTSQLVRSQSTAINSLATDVRTRLLMENAASEKKERLEVLDWLSTCDCTGRQRRIFEALYDSTCQWVFDQAIYKQWRESTDTILWLHGSSGAGKTFTISRVIDRLHQEAVASGRRVAYFYCDSNDISTQSLVDVLGSLIHQLCEHEKTLPSAIKRIYHEWPRKSGQQHQPTMTDLQRCLAAVGQEFCDVGIDIVIDALNESKDPTAIAQWMKCFSEGEGLAVKVFLCTILPPLADSQFSSALLLNLDTSGHRADIESYIHTRLQSMPKFRRMDEAMKSLCMERMKGNADGMFRWVQCQLDEIAKAKSPKDIEASLATVPRTLEELYNERLPRDPEDRHRFLWALKFLLAAPSPLQLTELAETTIMQCNAADGIHDSTLLTGRPDYASRLFENTDVLEILGPFARFEDQTGLVSVAHSSVRTYFLKNKVVDSWFGLSPEKLHADVALACLIYLTNVLRTSEAHVCTTTNLAQDYCVLVEEHPLLTYCAQYWPLHVVQSKEERLMLPLIRLYFVPKPTLLFSQWLRLLRQTSSTSYYVPGRWAAHDNVTYHAISHGLVHTTEHLLDAGVEINSVGGSWGGTLLHAACWTERPEILRCLLSRGVDYTTEDQHEDTAYDLLLWLDQREMQDAFFEHCRDLRPEDLSKSWHWVRIAELVLEKATAFVSHIGCCTCGLTARSRWNHCQVCRKKWCFECRGLVSIVPGFPDSVAELRGIAKMESITRNNTLEMRLRPNDEIVVSQPIIQDGPLASMHQVQEEDRSLFARSEPRSGDGTANIGIDSSSSETSSSEESKIPMRRRGRRNAGWIRELCNAV